MASMPMVRANAIVHVPAIAMDLERAGIVKMAMPKAEHVLVPARVPMVAMPTVRA